MAVVDDWMARAARYIVDAGIRVTTWADRRPADEIAAIIKEHCPFKDGVAYMPVPRCETCAHWHHIGVISDELSGACIKLLHVVPSGFGCVRHEKKL